MARAKGTGPNQADLAAALDVSISTVSRALSNAPGISQKVRDRVAKAAIELGYRSNTAVMRQSIERVMVIATLYGVNSTLAWVYQEMLEGIAASANETALPIETHMTSETTRIPAGLEARLTPTTGVMFLGLVPDAPAIDYLKERDIAAVIVNGVDPTLRVDSVSPANYFGGRLVAEHLAELGHRKVAFIGGPNRWTLIRRFHGFRDGLADFGGDGACVVDKLHLHSDTAHGHVQRLRHWLPSCLDQATALFCFNDSLARLAIEALNTLGKSVPDDISVAGFDDMPMATMSTPGLTSFRIDWQAVGGQALLFLQQRFAQKAGAVRELQIGGELIRRESTAQRK